MPDYILIPGGILLYAVVGMFVHRACYLLEDSDAWRDSYTETDLWFNMVRWPVSLIVGVIVPGVPRLYNWLTSSKEADDA